MISQSAARVAGHVVQRLGNDDNLENDGWRAETLPVPIGRRSRSFQEGLAKLCLGLCFLKVPDVCRRMDHHPARRFSHSRRSEMIPHQEREISSPFLDRVYGGYRHCDK